MKIIATFSIVLTIIVFSCKNYTSQVEVDFHPLQIKFNEFSNGQTRFSDYIDTIIIYQLDQIDSNQLIFIQFDKIIQIDSVFLVLDGKTSTVGLYNLNGSFISKVGNRGTAPGEYQEARDIVFDRKSNLISILSTSNYTIYRYDLNGKFVDNQKFDFPLYSFAMTEDGNYCFFNGYSAKDNYDVYLTDFRGKVKDKYFEYPEGNYPSLFDYMGIIKNSGFDVYYLPILSNIIYKYSKLTKNGFVAQYKIDIDHRLWPDHKKYNLEEFLATRSSNDPSSLLLKWFEIDPINDWIVMSYQKGRYWRNAYYNLINKAGLVHENIIRDPIWNLVSSNHPIGISTEPTGGIFYFISDELLALNKKDNKSESYLEFPISKEDVNKLTEVVETNSDKIVLRLVLDKNDK